MSCLVPRCTALLLILSACAPLPGTPGVSIEPIAPTTTDDLVAAWTAPEGADEDAAYTIRWTLNGNEQAELADRDTVPAASTTKGQEWTVEVTAGNGNKEGSAGTASVTVLNTVPEATLSFANEAPATSEDLEALVEITDADGDPTTASYSWSVDGVGVPEQGATISSDETAKGQVWEVTVTVSDDEADNPEPLVGSLTIGNTPPSVATATVLPEEPTQNDTMSCEASGWDDADGDEEGYSVSWTVEGEEVSTDDTLPGTGLARGQAIACALTPDDGDDVGDTAISSTVYLANTPPVITSLEIGPEEPLDEVAATAMVADDADGDELSYSYEWSVDGAVVSTDASLDGDSFAKDQAIQLTVVANDGEDDSDPATSNTIYGGNHTPEVLSVVLDPTTVHTDDVLTALASTDDGDGDSLTLAYAWYVNGSLVAETSDSLDGSSWFERGDDVYVEVTADDGETASDALASSSVTVSNTPPSSPELEWDTSEPAPSGDLQCVIATGSTDADGDAVDYTFSWDIDGVAYTDATTTDHDGDTLPAGAWEQGDEVWCSVVADDGFDDADVAEWRVVAPPCDSADASVEVDADGRWYVFCDDEVYWDEALEACQSMGGSWDLVSISSAYENAMVNAGAIANFAVSSSGFYPAWIGLTDEDVEGTWEWTDGTTLTYTNWGSSEPNGTSEHNAVMFRAGGSYGGDWNDIKAENDKPYVCSEP